MIEIIKKNHIVQMAIGGIGWVMSKPKGRSAAGILIAAGAS